MKVTTKHYPANHDKKWCAHASEGLRQITAWGETEEIAKENARKELKLKIS